MRTAITVATSVIVALSVPATTDAASKEAKHINKVLRHKVIKLHGHRAPGCDLVALRCSNHPHPTHKQVHRYFEVMRRMVMPKQATQYVSTGKPLIPPASAQSVLPGATLSRIAACESTNNPTAVDPTGTYTGLYQFDDQTWHSVGGTGRAKDASAGEQTARAAVLMAQRGTSPWPVCGR